MPLHRRALKAMGCPCELRIYAEDGPQAEAVLRAGEAEVRRLEAKYSRYRDDSLTARIARSAGDARGIEVDAETAGLLDYAAIAWEQSDGLFDITSGVLRRAWDFKSGCLPSQSAIDAVLPLIGWHKLIWRRPRLVLPTAGMELDFGGYVKEYTADAVTRVLRDNGVQRGLVDLGGDLHVVGPHPDGSAWQVGIPHPRQPGVLARIELSSGAIATSGDYERYMIMEGQRYCHILNPKTGWPMRGAQSVSVVADQCLVAGTASTIAMLKGGEGPAWLEALGLPYFCIDAAGGLCGTLAAMDAGI